MATIYEDAERVLSVEDGVLAIQALAGKRQRSEFGLWDAATAGRLPPGTAEVIRGRGKNPAGWYAVEVGGVPRAVLPPETRQAVEAAIARVNGPALRERRRVTALRERAEGLRDNPGAYFPALARAEKALADWRAAYPDEAAAEDRDDLRESADDLRRKAAGALVYDCDGSLSAEDRQRRHDELVAEAVELERRADAV